MFVVAIALFTMLALSFYVALLPFSQVINSGETGIESIIFLSIYSVFVVSILTFAGYKVFKMLSANKYRDIGKLKLQATKKKKASQDYSESIATPLQELPTSDSIQQLLSEDGEIPDEALQKKHYN